MNLKHNIERLIFLAYTLEEYIFKFTSEYESEFANLLQQINNNVTVDNFKITLNSMFETGFNDGRVYVVFMFIQYIAMRNRANLCEIEEDFVKNITPFIYDLLYGYIRIAPYTRKTIKDICDKYPET